ncbi:MAG: hypothetical protein ACRCUJ_01590, partial [Phocaeicola sp.]
LTMPFASAMRLQMVTNVIDYSTYIIENTTDKSNAYTASQVTVENPMSSLFIRSIIYDFLRIFSGGNVTNLDVDVEYVNPDQSQYPMAYTGSVANKKVKVRFPVGGREYFKLNGNTGLSDFSYFEKSFNRFIRCSDQLTPLWVDENGDRVSGPSSSRPSNVRALHKFWEIDQNRFVYWTKSAWWTAAATYPDHGPTATILAISGNLLDYGATIYNTTTKKRYDYDKGASQWKDNSGSILA